MKLAIRGFELEDLGLGVYAFDLYGETNRVYLRKKIDELPAVAPNSMNKYGRVLSGTFWRTLQAVLVADVASHARRVYPDIAPLKKNPYGFIVAYSLTTQRSLAKHSDSSDVTINVCLSEDDDFEGGELIFYTKQQTLTVYHRPGVAILHRGALEHRALPLKDGVRTNMILWCRARGSTW